VVLDLAPRVHERDGVQVEPRLLRLRQQDADELVLAEAGNLADPHDLLHRMQVDVVVLRLATGLEVGVGGGGGFFWGHAQVLPSSLPDLEQVADVLGDLA
jgi:hypothetical protein